MFNKPSFCVWSVLQTCGLAFTLALTLGGSILVGSSAAAADLNQRSVANSNVERYWVEAPVVDAQAVIEERTVERTERVCEPVQDGYVRRYRYEDRAPRRHNSTGASILGGLIGGVIGNQFGRGNGRKALTVAGALVGSNIARDRSRQRYRDDYREYEPEYEPEYQCRTRTRPRTIEDVVGYDVTYRYNDQLYTRRMDHAPGDTIKLRVRAVPDVAI